MSPAERMRMKINSKPWFENQVASQYKNGIYSTKKFAHSGLQTDKHSLKATEMG